MTVHPGHSSCHTEKGRILYKVMEGVILRILHTTNDTINWDNLLNTLSTQPDFSLRDSTVEDFIFHYHERLKRTVVNHYPDSFVKQAHLVFYMKPANSKPQRTFVQTHPNGCTHTYTSSLQTVLPICIHSQAF